MDSRLFWEIIGLLVVGGFVAEGLIGAWRKK